jgi:hypothetical protein
MVRKLAHVSLAVFLVLAFAAMASAAPDVASTSKKGSLLVFPKIVNTPTVDTYIFIGNDSTIGTYVKCYWMDENQSIEDFEFQLTMNQPLVFRASDNVKGPAFNSPAAGALTCWAEAISTPGSDVGYLKFQKFDHLYGYAMIKNLAVGGAVVFYNATAFAVTNGAIPANYCDSTSCWLRLEGSGFIDACPKYLVTNFVTGFNDILPTYKAGRSAGADLALWPCKQDLRQDRKPTCTKAKFDVWNESEVKFTGAYQCFKCFFEGYLDELGMGPDYAAGSDGAKALRYGRGPAFGPDKFWGDRLKTATARLRVEGIASSVCNNYDVVSGTPNFGNLKTKGCYWTDPSDGVTKKVDSEATPLLGVMTYSDPGLLFAAPYAPYAGYTLIGAGYNATGFIKYDNGGDIWTAPAK